MNRAECHKVVERLHSERGYGYTLNNAAIEPAMWLTWSTRLPERAIFAFIFKPFTLFRYSDKPFPETTLYVNDPAEYYDELSKHYLETLERLKEAGVRPDDMLDVGRLSGTRDVLEKHLVRIGERMQMVHDDMAAVFKVWVAETERAILGGWADFGSEYYFELPSKMSTLRLLMWRSSKLWRTLTHSPNTDAVSKDIDYVFSSFETDQALTLTAKAGLLFHHLRLKPLIQEALTVEMTYLALETIINAAIHGNPVPEWETIGAKGKLHGNAIYQLFKTEIVALWEECKLKSEHTSEKGTYDYVFTFRFQDELAPKMEDALRRKVDAPSLSTVRKYSREE